MDSQARNPQRVPSVDASNRLRTLAVLGLFVLLTVILLYPLSVQFGDHLPDWGDPLENTWVLASAGRALVTNPLDLYHANIFYPYPNALGFSESQVASAVTALPIWLATGNAVLAYNFVFLGAFVLSGFNAYLLAYDLVRRRGGAILAGAAFAFWAYKFNHLSHINLVTLQWLPLVLFALRRSLIQDRRVFPVLFAVTLVLQVLSSWYAALMTLLVVAVYLTYFLVFQRAQTNRRRVYHFLVCFGVALVPIALVAYPYFQVSRELAFVRGLEEAERFSARPLSFLSVAPFNWVYGKLLPVAFGEALFPGLVILVCAALGLRKKFTFPDRAFWIGAIVLFALIAFGPLFQLGGGIELPSPLYRLLYEFVPGFQGTRAPARFFVVSMLGLVLLAANGFGAVTQKLSVPVKRLVTAGVLVVLCIETVALPIRVIPIETNANLPAVYAWLETQAEGNVIELPVKVGDIEPITRAMYFSIAHQRATPLGYASFIPPTQADFLYTLNEALETPSPRLVNVLREFGVRYVIVNDGQEGAAQVKTAFAQMSEFEPVYEDGSHSVYQLNGNAPEHPLELGCLVPAYAGLNEPYFIYLTAQHTRRYPIVNADLEPHLVTLNQIGAESVSSPWMQHVRLPYVLRARVEGVPVAAPAPIVAGDYRLVCKVDGENGPTTERVVRVAPEFQKNDASPRLELLQMDVSVPETLAGGDIITTAYWRRRAEVRDPIAMQAQLVDEDGTVIAGVMRQPVLYTYPVRLWRENELVADSVALPIPQDAPPGTYHVILRAVDENTNVAVPFRAPDGSSTLEYSTAAFEIQE